jgi:hypothetical protein
MFWVVYLNDGCGLMTYILTFFVVGVSSDHVLYLYCLFMETFMEPRILFAGKVYGICTRSCLVSPLCKAPA